MKTFPIAAAGLTAALALTAFPALAQQKGDWTLGLGLGYVVPKDNNGTVLNGAATLDIGNSLRPTVTAEYFVWDNVGIEILAAWPFEHSINSDQLGGKIGTTQQLPPTVSVQYHFQNTSPVTPFLGVGLNYTTFFNEETQGALEGTNLSLTDSWGVAFHAGLDYDLNERGSLRADVRWIDINSDVKVNGEKIGKAEIDPWVFGAAYVLKF